MPADVEMIVRIAQDFLTLNLSPADLVRRSGFDRNSNSVAKNEILARLQRNPNLVDAWLTWSEDKRTDGGWYFRREGEEYVVADLKAEPGLTFSNRFEACAEFILKELDAITR